MDQAELCCSSRPLHWGHLSSPTGCTDTPIPSPLEAVQDLLSQTLKPRGDHILLQSPGGASDGEEHMRFFLTGSCRRVRGVAMGCRTLLLRLSEVWDEDPLCLDFDHTGKMEKRKNMEGIDSEIEGLLLSSPSSHGFSLLYALWMKFHPSLLKAVLLRLSSDLLALFGLFIFRWVILFCERQPVFDWEGYVYALVILGSSCCCAVSQHLLQRLSRKTEVNTRAALSGALYKKALSLSNSPQHQTPVCQLLVDIDWVSEVVEDLPWLVSSPLRVALGLGILWSELGPAVLVGVVLLFFLIPVHSALEKRIKLLQCSQKTIREERENLLKEMLCEIKALKLLAWIASFQQRVLEAWDQELEMLRVLGFLTAFSMLSRICMPFLVFLSSIGAFVLMDDGNVLMPSQVFMSLFVIKVLLPPFLKLHTFSSLLKQTMRSVCRLEEFFISENLDSKSAHQDHSQESPDGFLQNCDRCNPKHNENERELEQLPAHKSSRGALKQYISDFGWHWALLTLLAQLGVCVVSVAHDGLLCVWTVEAKEVQGLEEWKELRNSRLSVYTLLGLLHALLLCWAAYCLNCGCLRASQSLQCELLTSVLHLPLSVHLTTDPTHLLHTFTQDMYVIEERLPKNLHIWGSCLLRMIATILLITFIIPVFSLTLCPLIFLFLALKSHFSSVATCAKHMSSACSPVHETLCLSHSLQSLSQNLQVQHKNIDMERWALLRLEVVGAVGVFFISLALLNSADSLDSGVIALALVYGFNVTEEMHQFTMTSAEMAHNALPLQRICVYTKMKKEAQWTGGCRCPPGWPQRGELEFIHYGTKASPISPALGGLSFRISEGAKVGVVSREKAETDGLISSLFRAVEAGCGAVLIDGVNITSLGLHTLCKSLHLIPQVPVLVSGSLRSNVDPFAQYSDVQVWQVLELCHLKETVWQLQCQLLQPIQSCSTAYSFFSSGQKRLLCLARALLGKAKLLLVEEALPSEDSESERLLQQIVLTQLPQCTVLWLSQNPHSVLYTDRVLVLDAGHAVEFNSPSALVQQETLFRKLLRESQRGNV